MIDPPRVADVGIEAQSAGAEQRERDRPGHGTAAADLETEGEARQPNAGQDETVEIEWPRRPLAQILDEKVDQQHAQHADRNIDEEDPAPRPIRHDKAAE